MCLCVCVIVDCVRDLNRVNYLDTYLYPTFVLGNFRSNFNIKNIMRCAQCVCTDNTNHYIGLAPLHTARFFTTCVRIILLTFGQFVLCDCATMIGRKTCSLSVILLVV